MLHLGRFQSAQLSYNSDPTLYEFTIDWDIYYYIILRL